MKVALYARVSSKGPKADGKEQTPENQLLDLRAYCQARGWDVVQEFVDHGVSGAKERRPGLDGLMVLARARKIDALVVSSLDRWGRSLPHLVRSLEEFQALGVALVAIREGLDLGTPTGQLMYAVIGALAQYERAITRERILSGLRRVELQGTRSGKPVGRPLRLFDRAKARELHSGGMSLRNIGVQVGVPASTVLRGLRRNLEAHLGTKPPKQSPSLSPVS